MVVQICKILATYVANLAVSACSLDTYLTFVEFMPNQLFVLAGAPTILNALALFSLA